MPRGKTQKGPNDRPVPLARRLRRMMPPAERKLWWHLREAQFAGSHFRRQATIGRYLVDFCCHTNRLVIEVDGGSHAESRQMIADLRRSEFLQARGYRVLRFWNSDVLTNIEGVMTVIASALASGKAQEPPTPNPSPPFAARMGGGESVGGA
ncbi:MAG: endonuclease domain-containing protein [Xanthobacteraceae bacterium]